LIAANIYAVSLIGGDENSRRSGNRRRPGEDVGAMDRYSVDRSGTGGADLESDLVSPIQATRNLHARRINRSGVAGDIRTDAIRPIHVEFTIDQRHRHRRLDAGAK